jgi:hypothetical protein
VVVKRREGRARSSTHSCTFPRMCPPTIASTHALTNTHTSSHPHPLNYGLPYTQWSRGILPTHVTTHHHPPAHQYPHQSPPTPTNGPPYMQRLGGTHVREASQEVIETAVGSEGPVLCRVTELWDGASPFPRLDLWRCRLCRRWRWQLRQLSVFRSPSPHPLAKAHPFTHARTHARTHATATGTPLLVRSDSNATACSTCTCTCF